MDFTWGSPLKSLIISSDTCNCAQNQCLLCYISVVKDVCNFVVVCFKINTREKTIFGLICVWIIQQTIWQACIFRLAEN